MQDYTITRRLMSIGRSYTVENRNGERMFSIAGKVRFARTFSVKDRDSTVLYSVREKLLALHPTFVITRDGVETAVVTRTADEDSGEKFRIELRRKILTPSSYAVPSAASAGGRTRSFTSVFSSKRRKARTRD